MATSRSPDTGAIPQIAYATTGALALRARDGPVVRSPDLYPPRRSPALSARLTTLLAAAGSAPTRHLADWETPVYASDAEMDDALWEDLK